MANQPKKYQKFVATAATATLVASAIVPVASAAEKNFTDIERYAQETQDAIYSLVDRGVITGKSDSIFAPAESITRGQVVKMLGRYLVNEGVAEVPADWASKARFTDVPVDHKDQDLVKNAAVVADNSVFKGSNGKLNTSNNISRENMALVLDRAVAALNGKSLVELAAEEGLKGDVKDLNAAKAEARDAILALNAFGISAVDNFNPKNDVNRAQFALFLERTIEAVLSDTTAELVEKAVVAGNALPKPEDVTKENAADAQNKVDLAQKALDKAQKALDAETELDADEKLALQQKLDKVKEQIKAVKDAIEATKGDAGISSVKAINETTIEVKFGKEIDKDFIREAESNGKYFAIYKYGESIRGSVIQSESVNFTADGKSAEFVLDGKIQSGERYYVSLLDGPDTAVATEVHTYGPTELREAAKQPDFEVSSVSDKIYIKFGEKMKNSALDVENYDVYDNGGKYVGELKEFVTELKDSKNGEWVNAIEKKEVEFTLNPDASTPKLSAGKTYKIKLTTNLETDKNNTLNKDKLVINVKTPSIKEAAPKVTTARVISNDEIILVFDKDVTKVNLDNLNNLVEIKTATGKKINTTAISGAIESDFPNEVKLTLTPSDSNADKLDKGTTYTVEIPANIVTNAVFPNAVNEAITNIKATAQDNKAIASMSAKLVASDKNRKEADLVLTFDQRATISSIKDAITNDQLQIIDGTDVYTYGSGDVKVKYLGSDSSGKSVVIEKVNREDFFKAGSDSFAPKANETYTVEVKAGAIKVDAFNGEGAGNQSKMKATINGVSVNAPALDKITLETAEKLVIEFKEDIDSTIDLNKISISGFEANQNNFYTAKTLTGKSNFNASVSGNKLTLTAKDGVKFATGTKVSTTNLVEFKDAAVVSKASALSMDATAVESGEIENGKVDGVKVVDNAAPVLLHAAEYGNSLTDLKFTFTENVEVEGDIAGQFRTSGDAEKSSVGKDFYGVDNNELSVTFTDAWNSSDNSTTLLDVKVDYRAGQTIYIADKVGNKVKNTTLVGVKSSNESTSGGGGGGGVDKGELNNAIDAANDKLKNKDQYTADSVAAVEKAITDAKNAKTQTEIDKAAKAVKEATDALQLKEETGVTKVTFEKLGGAPTFTKAATGVETIVSVSYDKLPTAHQGSKYTITYDGKVYDFRVSAANPNKRNVTLPGGALTAEDLKDAVVTITK